MDEDRQLTTYDEMATRHNAAYAAFRTIHEAKYPPPEQPVVERDNYFIPIALVMMIFASVLVSGSRTVNEFGGGFFGIMAFVMLEGAIVAYAFYRTRRNFNEKRIEGVRRLANFGLALAFVVAVGANVHAVLKEKGVQVDEGVNTIILVMVAFSAPTLAFISGDIMAVETMANLTRQRKIEREHREAVAGWIEGLNTAWAREKSRWGVKVEFVSEKPDSTPKQLSALSAPDGQRTDTGHGYGAGYSKRTDARTVVSDYLNEHPDALSMPVRELAELLNVGKTTVAEVVKEFKRS